MTEPATCDLRGFVDRRNSRVSGHQDKSLGISLAAGRYVNQLGTKIPSEFVERTVKGPARARYLDQYDFLDLYCRDSCILPQSHCWCFNALLCFSWRSTIGSRSAHSIA
jgi:hypothetical protein